MGSHAIEPVGGSKDVAWPIHHEKAVGLMMHEWRGDAACFVVEPTASGPSTLRARKLGRDIPAIATFRRESTNLFHLVSLGISTNMSDSNASRDVTQAIANSSTKDINAMVDAANSSKQKRQMLAEARARREREAKEAEEAAVRVAHPTCHERSTETSDYRRKLRDLVDHRKS